LGCELVIKLIYNINYQGFFFSRLVFNKLISN